MELKFAKEVFSALGYEFSNSYKLGMGLHGEAYLTRDEGKTQRVIKFTNEKADAEMCHKLIGKNLKTIIGVQRVYHIKSSNGLGGYRYVIEKEFVDDLSYDVRYVFEEMTNLFDAFEEEVKVGNMETFLSKAKEKNLNPDITKFFIYLFQEMRDNKIWIPDLHDGNFGERGDGSYVLFDLGMGEGGHAVPDGSAIQYNESI